MSAELGCVHRKESEEFDHMSVKLEHMVTYGPLWKPFSIPCFVYAVYMRPLYHKNLFC